MWLERTELLLGAKGVRQLKKSKVLIIGLGGVGSFVAEFLTRAGIGELVIVDGDAVDVTNINRQLSALQSTIGVPKVEVIGERLLDINPVLKLTKIKEFIEPERASEIVSLKDFDYVVDCIDSITPKIELIYAAKQKGVKVISNMGAGGKVDPSKVTIRAISKTTECLLARVVRKRLKKKGVLRGVKAVFSTEKPIKGSLQLTDGKQFKKSFYGTNSYMPALFGLHAASFVIRELSKK